MKSYEQKYKAALEWMQGMYGGLHGKTKEEAEHFFPELKESKDEWIRKWLIRYFEQKSDNNVIFADISLRDILAWLDKQGGQKLANSAKTCKDDTLLDLLNKMPSCITVDGIDYHFVLKKTIAYMAFYEGEGEGSGKVIFWMTAHSPIDLLNEMLEILKEKGLLK